MVIYSGFSHEKWWFSIVMLVYQRVNIVHSEIVQNSVVLNRMHIKDRFLTKKNLTSNCFGYIIRIFLESYGAHKNQVQTITLW